MSLIAPNSVINLYENVKITDKQQLAFSSATAQLNYFLGHKKVQVQQATYFRHRRNRLRLQVTMAVAETCNYLSFINPSFESVAFYARIVDVEYVNNNTTEIEYVIDWFQTYMFSMTYLSSVIGREHLSQADFVKAEANPFDPSILEFQTTETALPTREMEKYYDKVNLQLNNTVNGDCINFPNTLYGYSIVLQVSNWDTSEISTSAMNDFEALFTDIITPDGKITKFQNDTNYGSADDKHHRAIPMPYYFYSISMNYLTISSGENRYDKMVENMQSALNFLTIHGAVSNVLGVYYIPTAIYYNFMYPMKHFINPLLIYPREYACVNKKLRTFPYQYIRVVNNEGDVKELRFEDFYTVIGDGTETVETPVAQLEYISTLDGTPSVSVVPVLYKVNFGWNINERIDNHNIPQLAYSTDAYLSFLSNQYQKTVGNLTMRKQVTDAMNWVKAGTSTAKAGLQLGFENADGIGTASKAYNEGMNAFLTQVEKNEARAALDITNPNAANSIASGDFTNSFFANTKPAYISDEYHAGCTNGTLLFHLRDTSEDPKAIGGAGVFTVYRVCMRDEYIKLYDDYFTMYGYTSNRLGVPRICNFIKGSTDPTQIPHFVVNADGDNSTYVKTDNMKVYSPSKEASDFVEQMFNNGMTFLKGDDL